MAAPSSTAGPAASHSSAHRSLGVTHGTLSDPATDQKPPDIAWVTHLHPTHLHVVSVFMHEMVPDRLGTLREVSLHPHGLVISAHGIDVWV